MSDSMMDLNVLFVDDEADNLEAFVFNCEEFWHPRTVIDPDEVMEGHYSLNSVDVVIVDLVFGPPPHIPPGYTVDPNRGINFLGWMQERHPHIPAIVLSAYLTPDIRARLAKKHPKVLCLDKPLDFSRSEFRDMIEKFISNYRTGR